ncbi:MAG TPA: hypothetical protein DCE18_06710 [Syntrophobacteraceae bacterium]|nr:hypothetical protein [Syntrophobacteraceae bacterium]
MVASLLKLLILMILCAHCAAPGGISKTSWTPDLTQRIPSRPRQALTGSQFAAYVAEMEPKQREQAIRGQLLGGNLPAFLRELVPVQLEHPLPTGKFVHATIFVMPDYLAIGSNDDFLRIPMNLRTAAAVASQFGFVLPTTKMVDAIYEQSAYHFEPEPMVPGPEMRSTEYYRIHNQKIKEQGLILGASRGKLVSGHKKDVVVTNLLAGEPGKIAIYGWHRSRGHPIQPLSTVHGARYADYSHGVRLVSDMVLMDGQFVSIYEILQDPLLADTLSDEGVVSNLGQMIGLWAA